MVLFPKRLLRSGTSSCGVVRGMAASVLGLLYSSELSSQCRTVTVALNEIHGHPLCTGGGLHVFGDA